MIHVDIRAITRRQQEDGPVLVGVRVRLKVRADLRRIGLSFGLFR